MSSERRRRGLMIVVSSPSGAGKTTLCKRLLASEPGVMSSVSVTTRPMRPREAEGSDYLFRTEAEFRAMVDRSEFLEWAEVFGRLYGTPRAEVEARLASGVDIVFDLDWQGARSLKTAMPGDVVSVFILPPSIDQLKARLEGREGATPEGVLARLAGAANDIRRWAEYDHVIVNDDLDAAFDVLRSIVRTRRSVREKAGLGAFVDDLLKSAEGEGF
ncbi:guanylate kinase [bacterium]|nr:guanylate kinase [bacterium]